MMDSPYGGPEIGKDMAWLFRSLLYLTEKARKGWVIYLRAERLLRGKKDETIH